MAQYPRGTTLMWTTIIRIRCTQTNPNSAIFTWTTCTRQMLIRIRCTQTNLTCRSSIRNTAINIWSRTRKILIIIEYEGLYTFNYELQSTDKIIRTSLLEKKRERTFNNSFTRNKPFSEKITDIESVVINRNKWCEKRLFACKKRTNKNIYSP